MLPHDPIPNVEQPWHICVLCGLVQTHFHEESDSEWEVVFSLLWRSLMKQIRWRLHSLEGWKQDSLVNRKENYINKKMKARLHWIHLRRIVPSLENLKMTIERWLTSFWCSCDGVTHFAEILWRAKIDLDWFLQSQNTSILLSTSKLFILTFWLWCQLPRKS